MAVFTAIRHWGNSSARSGRRFYPGEAVPQLRGALRVSAASRNPLHAFFGIILSIFSRLVN